MLQLGHNLALGILKPWKKPPLFVLYSSLPLLPIMNELTPNGKSKHSFENKNWYEIKFPISRKCTCNIKSTNSLIKLSKMLQFQTHIKLQTSSRVVYDWHISASGDEMFGKPSRNIQLWRNSQRAAGESGSMNESRDYYQESPNRKSNASVFRREISDRRSFSRFGTKILILWRSGNFWWFWGRTGIKSGQAEQWTALSDI